MYDGTGLDRISAKAFRRYDFDTENRVGEVPDAQNPLTRLQFLRGIPLLRYYQRVCTSALLRQRNIGEEIALGLGTSHFLTQVLLGHASFRSRIGGRKKPRSPHTPGLLHVNPGPGKGLRNGTVRRHIPAR